MSDCSNIKPLLGAYLDDELPAEQRDAVAAHLRACRDCARELAELRRVDQIALSIAPQRVSDAEAERLWSAIRPHLPAASAVAPRELPVAQAAVMRRARPWLRPMGAFAAAAILLIALGLAYILHPADGLAAEPAWQVQSVQAGSPDVSVGFYYDQAADVAVIWAVSSQEENGADTDGGKT